MDFGLGEEVEPTGSTSEGMWERRVAPGRSSAVTSVGGLADFVLATKKMSDCYTMGRNV